MMNKTEASNQCKNDMELLTLSKLEKASDIKSK